MNRALCVIGIIVVACTAFYGGAYYVSGGGGLPGVAGSAFARYDSAVGQVSALTNSSITLMLSDGTSRTIPISESTQVLFMPTPTPAGINNIRTGASVLVAVSSEVGASAEMIQIFSSATTPTQ